MGLKVRAGNTVNLVTHGHKQMDPKLEFQMPIQHMLLLRPLKVPSGRDKIKLKFVLSVTEDSETR